MEKYTTLLRLTAQANDLIDLDRWSRGLRLHTEYASLTSVIMKIGDEQRCYLSSSGCAGCTIGQCIPGCRTALLRRLIQSCFSSTTQITAVPRGLAPQNYTQIAVGWPKKGAIPLATSELTPWGNARLQVQWKASTGAPQLSALLCGGPGEPVLSAFFADHGWKSLNFKIRAAQKFFAHPAIRPIPISAEGISDVFVPLPGDVRERDPQPTELLPMKERHV